MPRVVIAAPGSGSGKTTITTGLLAALHRSGTRVSPHKVGPDYIDPGYHGAACGRVGRNLDPHLQGAERIVPLLLHGASTPEPADVAVIEGVMGLFDGQLGTQGFASTAHVATLTASPVVLVVDAAHMSRSVGALVLGFASYDPQVRIAAVVLNNVGSVRHEAEARAALAPSGIPVIGCVPRVKEIVVPSRHLGLVPAAERSPEAMAEVDALASLVAQHVDLPALLDVARTAPPLVDEAWSPRTAVAGPDASAGGRRVAVAGGRAFTFGYAEHTELLAAAGLEPVGFDPLVDPELPSGIGGLVIGGGFPEVHAVDLAANTVLRSAIARAVDDGLPVVAECAGLLYLADRLDGHEMCGVLPVEATFGSRLTLGYRTATAVTDSVLSERGQVVTGHEFHRTSVAATDETVARAWSWPSPEGASHTDGFVRGSVHAAYLHTHWAGHPALVERFAAAVA
nr:cobyrinate a,c-diamide synthase [Arsenicicoccus piscis]